MDKKISHMKNTICQMLINDNQIVAAIDADEGHEDLMYYHIFPSLRRPQAEVEKRTFICMRVNVDNEVQNNILVNRFEVSLYVVTHDDLQYPTSGVAVGCTRTDFIAERIEQIFNRNKLGLSDATLLSDMEEQVDARHPMRVITFRAYGSNGVVCA